MLVLLPGKNGYHFSSTLFLIRVDSGHFRPRSRPPDISLAVPGIRIKLFRRTLMKEPEGQPGLTGNFPAGSGMKKNPSVF